MLRLRHRFQHYVDWHIHKHYLACGCGKEHLRSIINPGIQLIYLLPLDRHRIDYDGEGDRPRADWRDDLLTNALWNVVP